MENIILYTLLGPKPKNVPLPLKPLCEETIPGSSAQSEPERNAANAQQELNWLKKFQRITEVGILCGDKPLVLADQNLVAIIYLSIGVEGGRIFNCKKPHTLVEYLTAQEIWN